MARKAVCLIRVLQGIDRVSISIDAGVSVSISKKSAFPENGNASLTSTCNHGDLQLLYLNGSK